MQNDEQVSPLKAALKAASISAGLITGLGLATGSIAIAGVALVGTAMWFLAKNKTINPIIEAHGLTPNGEAFACGIQNQTKILQKGKTR